MVTSNTDVLGKSGARRWIPSAAAFILVTGLALFFRSYELLPREEISDEKRQVIAENLVRQSIQRQILTQLQASGSQIPRDQQGAFAARQAETLLQTDKRQFEEAVNRLLSSMPPSLRPVRSHRYLLESDPYHFMAQVQNILETGKVSERVENGKFHDPLRCYPHGYWVPVGAQPLVGIAVYKAASFFKPGIELMEALGYVPLVLVPAGILAFFLLCRTLGFGTTASAAGALTLSLSPIFLQRSSYGWFDTDPFNHLFPSLILALFFSAFEASRRRTVLLAAGAGALTGLYVLFWLGWPFIFLLVLGMGTVFSFRYWLKKDVELKGVPFFLPVYLLATLVVGVAAAGPATFTEFIFRGASYIGKFAVSEPDTWPNIFLMVGETTSVGLKRLIFLTGNYVTTIFIFLGMASIFWIRKYPELKRYCYRWAGILLMALPLLLLSLGTERFAVLLVTPAALFTALGVESLGRLIEARLRNRNSAAPLPKPLLRFWKAGWAVLVLAALLPMQIMFAHALAMKSEPIMNDTWYSGMETLRDKTPADSVVYSWWPPGYFISTLAKRSVFADGGNQDLPGSYWLSRVFMALTEEEAIGVMRMMNGSGTEALEKIRSYGLRLAEAMDVLNQILPLDKESAAQVLRARFDAAAAEDILKMTHSESARVPTYLFVYSEMVEKNLALSVFARWNFHKAALIQRTASAQNNGPLKFLKGSRQNSIHQFLASSDGVLKYRPEEMMVRREGAKLYFKSGLTVDWEKKQALIQIPSEGVNGTAASLFYVDQGELQEVPGRGTVLNISVLVYEEQGNFFSVIADRDLIRSLLFRLYYLKGAGLRSFKPVFEKTGETPSMTVQIFETDWNALHPESA